MPDSRMSDSYYVKIDDADSYGEHFVATDLVRSTWSAAIQHAAPVSALLVRALQRCAPRDDTRLSRVLVDLLGPVPADGDLWVRATRERPGTQIELIGAELLAILLAQLVQARRTDLLAGFNQDRRVETEVPTLGEHQL